MNRKFIHEPEVSAVNTMLAVNDRTFIFSDISVFYKDTSFFAEFYDENNEVIFPSAGTIEILGCPFGNTFLKPTSNNVIEASAMNDSGFYTLPNTIGSYNNGSSVYYTPVSFYGGLEKIKVSFNGIVGATFCKIMMIQTNQA